MIRNVILDWSGTLVDDLGPVLDATNGIFREYGRQPLTRGEFRRHFRLPFSGFYAEWLPEAAPDDLEAHYERHFDKLQDGIELLPGAREFLELCLRTQRRTFLLSTIKPGHFERQAARLGVTDLFEHCYVGIMDKREKIREILASRSLDPAATIFVGDMVHDLEAARHGGILGVAVLTGFDPPDKLLDGQPDLIVRDLRALAAIL